VLVATPILSNVVVFLPIVGHNGASFLNVMTDDWFKC